MKKILIPTDFSKFADEAIEVGAQLARKNNCEIILIHMLELPRQMNDAIFESTSIPEVILYKRRAEELLKKLKNKASLKDIPVTEVVRLEGVYEGLASYTKINPDIDLIVMGSQGSGNIQNTLVGANTEKIIRYTEIPVLVIKNKIKEFNFKNIVFASDYKEETKKPFVKLLKFAKSLDAKLNLVMICTPNKFISTIAAQEHMNTFIAGFDMPEYSTNIYNDTNVAKGILNFSYATKADLIYVCARRKTVIANFFNGSISEGLVNHSEIPIVTFTI